MEEVWKPIPELSSYEASNLGISYTDETENLVKVKCLL